MKRLLSLMLAAAMVLSIGAMTVSAADIDYPVAFVWDTGFLKDEDGVLQIGEGDGVSSVPYGSTVYFPLINTNYENHNELVPFQNALEEAKRVQKEKTDALTAATTARDNALASTEIVNLKNTWDAKEALLTEAKEDLEEAQNAPADPALISALEEVIGLIGTLNSTKQTKVARETDIENLEIDLDNWNAKLTAITNHIIGDSYITQLDQYYTGGKTSLPDVYNDLVYVKSYIGETLSGAITYPDITTYTDETDTIPDTDPAVTVAASILSALNTAKTQLETKIGSSSATEDSQPSVAGVNIHQWIRHYTKVVDGLESDISSSESTINAKCSSIETNYEVEINNNFDTAELESLKSSGTAPSRLQELEDAVDTATTARDNAKSAYDDAVKTYNDDVDAKQAAKDAADAAVTTAQNNLNNAMTTVGNAFVFVTESAAVSNAKVKADWEYGSKYVDKIELDKVKATSTEFGMGGTTKSIYCIAVTLEESKSTDEVEVEGEIAISKSGSNGYSLADTAAYISLNVGAPIADPDSEITATPQLFEEDYSFDAEEDHIFYFEEDSSSWFEVNTKSQKDIVLAFDTEWDDDLADEIYEKNPNADLDFYNGNYA
ncbi:MAG: hypothetical protein IKL92_06040, partial [Oscillospiraceae bacterium]|nr:hypothetical protein [Oscillospiraceae bacterium]